MAPLNVIDVSAENDLSSVPVEFLGSEDADLTGSVQYVHWVMRDETRTVTIGAGSSPLGMRQDGMIVTWTGSVDLTAGGTIVPREGDFVGFFVSGYDAAGNDFPVVSNSEASPIPELAEDDTDFERQWVRLGAVGAELRVASIALSDDHVAPRSSVTITVGIQNVGGATNTSFNVHFYAGDAEEPFARMTMAALAPMKPLNSPKRGAPRKSIASAWSSTRRTSCWKPTMTTTRPSTASKWRMLLGLAGRIPTVRTPGLDLLHCRFPACCGRGHRCTTHGHRPRRGRLLR